MKINHMDNGTKLLLLAVAAIITCIVCGIAFYVTREGKSAVNTSTNQFNQMTTSYQEIDITMYDKLSVSGAEVKTIIEESSSDSVCNVTVKTLRDSVGTTYTGTANELLDGMTKGSAKYINPSANFLGSVTKDGNGLVTMLTFTQQP